VWRVFASAVICLSGACGAEESAPKTGSAIFYHVDGAGIAQWQMARMVMAGPDGEINWDKLPHVAVYRGHAEDTVTPSSNAGATMHAYGVKVPYEGYGTDKDGKRPLSAAGRRKSIMEEAKERGIAVGVINTGGAAEPGTACFLTSVADRESGDEIVAQLVESGADLILVGGEEYFLPEGTRGRFGVGKREDKRNLVEEAEAAVSTRKKNWPRCPKALAKSSAFSPVTTPSTTRRRRNSRPKACPTTAPRRRPSPR
jgi:alkaline phosphatase